MVGVFNFGSLEGEGGGSGGATPKVRTSYKRAGDMPDLQLTSQMTPRGTSTVKGTLFVYPTSRIGHRQMVDGLSDSLLPGIYETISTNGVYSTDHQSHQTRITERLSTMSCWIAKTLLSFAFKH
jgi:hypothetical protein